MVFSRKAFIAALAAASASTAFAQAKPPQVEPGPVVMHAWRQSRTGAAALQASFSSMAVCQKAARLNLDKDAEHSEFRNTDRRNECIDTSNGDVFVCVRSSETHNQVKCWRPN